MVEKENDKERSECSNLINVLNQWLSHRKASFCSKKVSVQHSCTSSPFFVKVSTELQCECNPRGQPAHSAETLSSDPSQPIRSSTPGVPKRWFRGQLCHELVPWRLPTSSICSQRPMSHLSSRGGEPKQKKNATFPLGFHHQISMKRSLKRWTHAAHTGLKYKTALIHNRSRPRPHGRQKRY